MAVSDYQVGVTFATADDVLSFGERVEVDAAVDTEWAPIIAAGWFKSVTSNAQTDPTPTPHPDWS